MLAEPQDVLRLSAPRSAAITEASPRSAFAGRLEAFHRASPRAIVVAVDLLLIVAAAVLTGGTRLAAVFAAAFLTGAVLERLYIRRSTLEAQGISWYMRLLPVPLLATALALVAAGYGSVREVVPPIVTTAALLAVVRAVAWLFVAADRRRGRGLRPVLLVGPPAQTAQVARRIEAYPEAGVKVAATFAPMNMNGDRSRARALLQAGAVSHVLFTGTAQDAALLDEIARWSAGWTVAFGMVLPVWTGPQGTGRIGDLRFVSLGGTSRGPHKLWSKRLLDVVVSALLLVLLAPVLVLASLAIFLYDGGPVIYRQRRVGRDNREFTIWKFRSMVPGADHLTDHYASANMASGLLFKLPDDPRVTPVGHLIRRLSIDELPQLVNVLKGDMSLVGPRPLPVEPDDFDAEAARRHRVRPGITGPWQVAGGHLLGYDEMIKLDLAYVDGWSLRRDLWYLAMTLPAVMVRRSVY